MWLSRLSRALSRPSGGRMIERNVFRYSSHLPLHRYLSTALIEVPSMGDSITEGEVVELLKQVGESVQEDEVVAIVETDKVSVDIRSTCAGVVTSVAAKPGDTLKVGAELFKVDTEGQDASTQPEKEQETVQTSSSGSVLEIQVPAMGDSITEGEISEIEASGTSIEADQVVAVIETDKVSVDVRSPSGGVIQQVHAQQGDTVTIGQLLVSVSSDPNAKPLPSKAVQSKPEEKVVVSKPSSGSAGAYKPLIQFRYGANRNKMESAATSNSSVSSGFFIPSEQPYEEIPMKYQRKAIPEDEIDAIESGGATLF